MKTLHQQRTRSAFNQSVQDVLDRIEKGDMTFFLPIVHGGRHLPVQIVLADYNKDEDFFYWRHYGQPWDTRTNARRFIKNTVKRFGVPVINPQLANLVEQCSSTNLNELMFEQGYGVDQSYIRPFILTASYAPLPYKDIKKSRQKRWSKDGVIDWLAQLSLLELTDASL